MNGCYRMALMHAVMIFCGVAGPWLVLGLGVEPLWASVPLGLIATVTAWFTLREPDYTKLANWLFGLIILPGCFFFTVWLIGTALMGMWWLWAGVLALLLVTLGLLWRKGDRETGRG